MWTCICWTIIFIISLQGLMACLAVAEVNAGTWCNFCVCVLHSQCCICILVFAGLLSSFSSTMIWRARPWKCLECRGAEGNAGRLCIFHYFSCICIFVFLYLWDHYLHSLPPGFHGVPASGSVLGAEVNAGRRWNYIRGIIRLPSHCEFQISPWEPYKILRRKKR